MGRSSTASLIELEDLVRSAGAKVVGRVSQRLPRISPTHYIGPGKLEQLVSVREEIPYTVAVFDDELTPRQQKNLEDSLHVKVIDRTALILDIFARRAYTREGQLQVELAQHQYLLPRLAGQWSHLERLGGGIGTRGPGESQLETDRRLIRERISTLRRKLEEVRRHRALYQERRRKAGVPVVALVGYTSAGKSTLLNTLAKATVPVSHTMFSTLDPVTRRIVLPDRRQFLLTDTVGFIDKLPPTVVAAFRATLEELNEADLLLHIVDITHSEAARQTQIVEKVLEELGINGKRRLTIINKMDLVVRSDMELVSLSAADYLSKLTAMSPSDVILISAAKGWGLEQLLTRVAVILATDPVPKGSSGT